MRLPPFSKRSYPLSLSLPREQRPLLVACFKEPGFFSRMQAHRILFASRIAVRPYRNLPLGTSMISATALVSASTRLATHRALLLLLLPPPPYEHAPIASGRQLHVSCLLSQPIDGAVDALKEMVAEGVDVRLCTSPLASRCCACAHVRIRTPFLAVYLAAHDAQWKRSSGWCSTSAPPGESTRHPS